MLALVILAGLVLLASASSSPSPAPSQPKLPPGSKLPPKPTPPTPGSKPPAPTSKPERYEARDSLIEQALCDLHASAPWDRHTREWLRLFVALNVYPELTWPSGADDDLPEDVPLQQELLWDHLLLKVLPFHDDPVGYCAAPVQEEPPIRWEHDAIYSAMCGFHERHPRTRSMSTVERAYVIRGSVARSVYPQHRWPNDMDAASVPNSTGLKAWIWTRLLQHAIAFSPALHCE